MKAQYFRQQAGLWDGFFTFKQIELKQTRTEQNRTRCEELVCLGGLFSIFALLFLAFTVFLLPIIVIIDFLVLSLGLLHQLCQILLVALRHRPRLQECDR